MDRRGKTKKVCTETHCLKDFAFSFSGALSALPLGRLGVVSPLFNLHQKAFFLALFFEYAHGLFKAIFVRNLNFNHDC